MRRNSLLTIVVVFSVLGFAEAQVPTFHAAPNYIVPQSRAYSFSASAMPHHARMPQRVQVTEVQVGVVILEQVATTTMDVHLYNPSRRRQEAQLLIPVPDGATLMGFDFHGKAKEPTAKLLPKAEAKRTYQAIVAQVRDPALLEFTGMNLIQSSVFPLEARGSQKIRITYEHLLSADGNRIDYVLPRSESLDFSVPWTIAVEIKSKRRISTAYSPSHEIKTLRRGDKRITALLAEHDRSKPGPFRLSFLLETGGVSASLFAYPDPKTGGGYFLLLAGAPGPKDNSPSIKRELTVVLDRSGSMSGKKIKQSRKAALQVLSGLNPGETFNLLAYNESLRSFSSKAVEKTEESIKKARAWLEGMQPRGGTNIHDALVEALRRKPAKGSLPIVIFLTDGLPTIGQTSEQAISDLATRANPAKRRIFTFGVGVDVNTPLLTKIASETRAFATFVLPGEDVELKVSKVFNSLKGPVLANPQLGVIEQGRVRDLLPQKLPDLFEKDQMVVLGRYLGEKPIAFEISGNYLGHQRRFSVKFDPQRASTKNGFVPRLWASRKIAALTDAIRSSGADTAHVAMRSAKPIHPRFKELVDEIVLLSTEFGILTEYTAFLAREGTDLGSRSEVLATARHNFKTRAVRTRSGLGSVNQDMNRQFQARQQALNPGNEYWDQNMNRVSITNVQQVNDQAFYRRGKRWVDSRLVEKERGQKPKKVIRFGSKEFKQLAERLAKEGRQGSISLRGDILMQVDGKSVLVTSMPASK
ncbi:MAG: VWA domain-containing protein [Deltaproteobacteria bacterium]|nr:VWA domain-containing protein [Deltaproteobacteria bacterium]